MTARRTEENLQTVPISITAVSGEQLRNANVTTGLDLQKLVPTLSTDQSPASTGVNYALRGIRNGVITYLGEVPVSSRAIELQIWDLQSVQAISGPQGTLFGRNSTGGAILFVPQKPTADLGGFVDARVGNYDAVDVSGVVNLPVNDMLKFRVGGQISRRDGYVDNLAGRDLGSRHRDSFRASMLFEPNDKISNYTVYDYGKTDETPLGNIETFLVPCAAGGVAACIYGPAATAGFLAQQQYGPRTVNDGFNNFKTTKAQGLTNVLSIDLGPATAKYIFGHREEESRHSVNFTSTPQPGLVSEYFYPRDDATVHELQLLGKAFDERFDWVLGAYYERTVTDSDTAIQFPPILTTSLDRNSAIQSSGTTKSLSKALYGQVTFALTEKLRLTGGLRYTDDKSSGRKLNALLPGVFLGLPPGGPPIAVQLNGTQDQASDATTYTIAVDYQATPDVLLYATTRKGYNAGGFNAPIPIAPYNVYAPEKIHDYEAGVKSSTHLGGAPVRANGSVFYAEYTDIQRFNSAIPVGGGAFLPGTQNAAEATIYGLQFDVLIKPVEQLTLQAGYGYLHTKYDSFQLAGVDYSGSKFAQAPEHTFNGTATWRQPLPVGELVASASYAYISSQYFDDANNGKKTSSYPGYGLVDLRLGWEGIEVAGNTVDVSLWAKNITNKLYPTSVNDVTNGYGFIGTIYGEPRMYGIQARVRFGG